MAEELLERTEAQETSVEEGAHERHDHDHCGCGHEHYEHHHHDHCDCGHEHHHHDHCDCDCDHDNDNESYEVRELREAPSLSYHVLDIDCPHCAMGAQNAVRVLPCVKDARIVYATSTLDVVLAANTDSLDARSQILETIRSCGLDLELSEKEREELSAERSWYREHREQVLMGISGVALALGLVVDHLVHAEVVAIPLYVVAALAGLVFVAPMAWAALRRHTADMNVLMGIAVIGGLIMGALGDHEVFGDAAIVIFLDQVGEWLEGWSMRKTSGSIKELMDLTPDEAHVVDAHGHVHDVEVNEVEEGERIRILPGERVPLDGVVLQGRSSFNEAPVTGESMPQDKGPGAEVYAGSLNTSTAVEIEVTADEDCTTLARIISLVQGAQAEKAPYESFVDRFAAAYTPIVICGAVVAGLVVPLLLSVAFGFHAPIWHDWVYRALSLLVVACPCALVISTPVSFVSALTRAAKMGVLVKGGAYFDIATKVDTVAFDKTGTLTKGQPSVVDVACLNGATERDVLQIACTLEQASTHPLARAVVARAEELGLGAAHPEHVEEVAANGMIAQVDGVEYVVGKLDFARSCARVPPSVAQAVSAMGRRGASALVVCGGGRVAGVIGIADTIRPGTPEVMERLVAEGVDDTLMLTGDNRHAAHAVAEASGVSGYAAELLPGDKVSHIAERQQAGQVVAMVGDGINDAPALATADLGITMGAAASDTALEVSDVALLSDDLGQLPAFFALSAKTMHVVRENIAFAIGIKVLVFVLVVAGKAGMGAAVFADTGVALIVILNGMRLMLDSKIRW